MPRLKPKRPKPPPAVIGWREHVRLPELGIGPIIAKVDTGARSAALHAEDIKVRGHRVQFRVPINGHNHHCDLPLRGRRRVKSTSGHTEARCVIESDIKIGRDVITAEITLTNRTDMGTPMLLGRTSIRGRYVVHPGKSFIISRAQRKKT
jgi:hypothetical protein